MWRRKDEITVCHKILEKLKLYEVLQAILKQNTLTKKNANEFTDNLKGKFKLHKCQHTTGFALFCYQSD